MTLLFVLGILSGAHVLMILAIFAAVYFINKSIVKKRSSGSQKYKGGLNERIGKR